MNTKIVKIVFCIFICSTALYSEPGEQNFISLLDQDVKQGVITQTQNIVIQLQAIYHPETLAQKYRAVAPTLSRNTTALKLQLLNLWPELSQQQQQQYRQYLTRPQYENLEKSITSPSGLFKIHYTQIGEDAASDEFIINTAESYDYAYNYEVNVLGFMPPPIDDPADPQYDVYVYNFGDYGSSTPENPVISTSRDDYTGWIEMDNDFTHTKTSGLAAIQVTAAHEFFHLVQFGYRVFMNTSTSCIFLFESTAAWMEDVVYDDVNDYYQYLPYFFKAPNNSFSQFDGTHEYAMSIFFHYLAKKYDRDITRQVWEEFINTEPYDAIDNVLGSNGSNLANGFAEFAIWNYFTGSRADTARFYPEGDKYPMLTEQGSYEITNSLTFDGQSDQIGFNYYRINVSASGDFTIHPSFPDPQYWIYAVIIEPFESTDYSVSYSTCGGNGVKQLTDIRSLSDILFIPVYAKKPTTYMTNTEDFTVQFLRGEAPQLENKLVSIFPNPANLAQNNNVTILFQLQKMDDNIKVSILSEEGILIKQDEIGKRPDGISSYIWDGTNSDNKPVASGIYLFFIESDELIGPGKVAIIR